MLENNQTIPTSVYTESTPNPAAMKFVADRVLIAGGMQAEYQSKLAAKGSSPLAEELFNFPFVKSVFISGNYVTLVKDDSLSWDMIAPQLEAYIQEWLSENYIAVSGVPTSIPNQLVEQEIGENNEAIVSGVGLEPSEFDEEIRFLLNEYVRPAVESDGGAIDFVGYADKKVYVQLKGSCSGCPSSTATLKDGIENLLKAKLPLAVDEVIAESV